MYDIEYFIRFYGVKRFGNHAIIRWVLSQSTFPQAHFNDIRLNVDPIHKRKRFRTVKPTIGSWPPELLEPQLHVVMISHESRRLDRAYLPYPSFRFKNIHNIVLLRDFKNWLVSFASYRGTIVKRLRRHCRLWIHYAKEFIGETNYLNNKITINYNRWYQDGKYRKQLFKLIPCMTNYDANAHRQIPLLRGRRPYSKFYRDINIPVEKLGVLDRWKLIPKHKTLIQMCKEFPEAVKLSKMIFGNIYG